MELYQRQQFEFLLVTATDRYVERLVQRNEGAENALARMNQDPNGEGIWIDQFVDAIFEDFLLNNVGGATFILSNLHAFKVTPPEASQPIKIDQLLPALAKQAFTEILRRKTVEFLEQQATLY